MRRADIACLLAALLVLGGAAEPGRRDGRGVRGTLELAGTLVQVQWTDGDTFRFLSGPQQGARARLAGLNTLETFGPVHRIGASDGRALLAIAGRSAELAAAAGGRCELAGRADRYGRLLVSCPEVSKALVRAGHAMVLSVGAPADPALVALQQEAQRAGAGMWAGGAPPLVPTSLHSADERDLGPRGAYDRVVDTRTGASEVRPHARIYRACEEICLGDGKDRACMTYVPFERRYRDRPACLR